VVRRGILVQPLKRPNLQEGGEGVKGNLPPELAHSLSESVFHCRRCMATRGHTIRHPSTLEGEVGDEYERIQPPCQRLRWECVGLGLGLG